MTFRLSSLILRAGKLEATRKRAADRPIDPTERAARLSSMIAAGAAPPRLLEILEMCRARRDIC